MTASWSSRVVAHLCDSKHAGLGFDDAWNRAMIAYPPRGRDLGPERPTLFAAAGGESLVTCSRRYCADAWYGRRPGLAHFHPSLLTDGEDEFRPTAKLARGGSRTVPYYRSMA